MGKKSFKGGLGSLLQNTVKQNEQDKLENMAPELLRSELLRCKEELYLWRRGYLTPKIFAESLKQEGLAYKPETNQIVRIEETDS